MQMPQFMAIDPLRLNGADFPSPIRGQFLHRQQQSAEKMAVCIAKSRVESRFRAGSTSAKPTHVPTQGATSPQIRADQKRKMTARAEFLRLLSLQASIESELSEANR